ncbi:uncharacterized protein LOC134780694 [Penaeus indicus]|uniref:uncharacterized protein LOC134780694 n=1 Tax=Penaeus indicus TaxID=29960 RepID=UPI00300C7E7D
MASIKSLLVALALVLGLAAATPVPVAYALPMPVALPDGGGYSPYKEELGRVKIQVYRGPNKEKIGYDHFAPWGFYFTQPEDYKPYGYH